MMCGDKLDGVTHWPSNFSDGGLKVLTATIRVVDVGVLVMVVHDGSGDGGSLF